MAKLIDLLTTVVLPVMVITIAILEFRRRKTSRARRLEIEDKHTPVRTELVLRPEKDPADQKNAQV